MRKKYIRFLSIIMLVTVVLLIFVQVAWVDKALIIEEQEFRDKVNNALSEIVKITEEREALLQITHSSVPFGRDTSELSGSKFLFEENFTEKENEIQIFDSAKTDSVKKQRIIYNSSYFK